MFLVRFLFVLCLFLFFVLFFKKNRSERRHGIEWVMCWRGPWKIMIRIYCLKNFVSIGNNTTLGDEEIAHWLRELVLLAESLNFVPMTHNLAHKHL